MFNIYDKVFIISNKVNGVIIDIFEADGETIFTVESNIESSDEYGTLYPLFYCKKNEIKKV